MPNYIQACSDLNNTTPHVYHGSFFHGTSYHDVYTHGIARCICIRYGSDNNEYAGYGALGEVLHARRYHFDPLLSAALRVVYASDSEVRAIIRHHRRGLWRQACEFDGIDDDAKFVCHSNNNPHAAALASI